MKLHAPSNRNTSLEKASRILFAFDEETSQLGVMDIARRVGLNKSTVSRFVSSLTDDTQDRSMADREHPDLVEPE